MIIIIQKCGRLGNRLLLLSHLIAYGIENGHRVVDVTFDEYAQYFTNTANNPYIVQYPATKSWLEKLPFDYSLTPTITRSFARAIRKLVNRYPKLGKDYQFLPGYKY